jgi:membrane-associated phospholipid phosphatase
MRSVKLLTIIAIAIGIMASAIAALLYTQKAGTHSAANMNAIRGLAPVSMLQNTVLGKMALARNLTITAAIQNGNAKQATLLPFLEQQQLALRDAFITDGNAYGLADGLGTDLEHVYRHLTTYENSHDSKKPDFTNISPAIAQLIAYANATTKSDSGFAKFFFGNGTTDGHTPVSKRAITILNEVRGTVDIFGRAYDRPAGTNGADLYGNSRPFQTEISILPIAGRDFFGRWSSNMAYLRGPEQNLINSPSFPSGHATYGYLESLLLALLVPQRYSQMVTRAAEYGNDRIVLGAHYAMDVVGGRTLALYGLAQLLANKADYVGLTLNDVKIDDFQTALAAARVDMTKALEDGCGARVAVCALRDHSRFADSSSNRNFYEATQTYDLPVVFEGYERRVENVAELAPEAGYLLTIAFPCLTLAQADDILTETEGPGGGFLDDGSGFGLYSRLDLYRASEKALTLAQGHCAHD